MDPVSGNELANECAKKSYILEVGMIGGVSVPLVELLERWMPS